MASLSLFGTTAQAKSSAAKAPITKPSIQLSTDRFTAEALWSMGRIGSVVVDSEAERLAYTVSYFSIEENRSTTWIRLCRMTADGQLEQYDEFVGSAPAWYGKEGAVAYLRQGKLYLRQAGKDIAVSGFEQEIEDFLLSPEGDQVVLVSAVKTRLSTVDRYADLPLASGKVIDDLMYKHWDEWVESAPQPFVCKLEVKSKRQGLNSATITRQENILAGTPYESPMRPFGGAEQLAWHPNNEDLAYTCRKKSGIDYALSTNSDIYLYNTRTRETQNLTAPNGGYDTNPQFSSDGRWMAWLSMERDGYESDQNRLMVRNLETGEQRQLAKGLDTNIDAFFWRDSTHLVCNAVWHATEMLYQVDLDGSHRCLTNGQYDYEPCGQIGERTICLRHSTREANEIYAFRQGEEPYALTHENQNIYQQVEMGRVEPIWQTTSDGKQMLTWIIYPPHFDPTRQYPTLLYCEGGPQSPVSQFWSYRWNFMMMAAHDYIVVAPNRRGLPGFGLEWNEAISGDYGGQCMEDYFSAIDQFATENSFVDKEHLGCVGASFGGYSVYWIAGHHQNRFKAFIAHDGIFNLEMQYLETEEKWFANWDLGGAYWDKTNPIAQRTFANSPHRFVDQWNTPILCIHGEKDYRILANQAMAAFDAAKMRGVPAQLLIFPDENHWVLQAQNGILWQRTFFGWLDKWLKKD